MYSRKRPASGVHWHPRLGYSNTEQNSLRRKRRMITENAQLLKKERSRPRKDHQQPMTLFRKPQELAALWDGLAMEILLLIFRNVVSQDPKSLFKCRLTCRAWHRVCEDPQLWSDVMINISKRRCTPKLFDFLARHEISQICSNVTSPSLLERAAAAVPVVKVLACNRFSCHYELLAKVAKSGAAWLSKVQKVSIKCTSVAHSRPAINAIVRALTSIISELHHLQTLYVENFYKISLPPCSMDCLHTLTLRKCKIVDLSRLLPCFPVLEEMKIVQSSLIGLWEMSGRREHNFPMDSLRRLLLTHCELKLDFLPFGASLSHIDLSFSQVDEDVLERLLLSIPDGSLTHLDLSCIACTGPQHITALEHKFSPTSASHLVLRRTYGIKKSSLLWLQNRNANITVEQ